MFLHSCMSYMTRDMITKLKNFERIFFKRIANLTFSEKSNFQILIISQIIFDLQKYTIPQTKAKDILFWPYFVRFLATINTSWDRKQWSCLIFLFRLYVYASLFVFMKFHTFLTYPTCEYRNKIGCIQHLGKQFFVQLNLILKICFIFFPLDWLISNLK